MASGGGKNGSIGTRLLGIRGPWGDIALAVMVASVVVMLVVPLTQWLLDLSIAVNLGLTLLVFSLALFIRRPLSFTAFPTVLLVATLFRLALNVSSTRLILLEADAGRIIGAFGTILVGGDILVGAVIFGILVLVLFLVIAKGAERVAEVAARFTLDALPGRQLAIEADLKAGSISPREVTRRRAALERESHYYGALDGAMKFVRGDAIAGLVIIFVNILGGIAVGMIRHGMGVGEALDTYGRLTVGDGLVTMIPALLVSTAAGLLVTRVGQQDRGRRLGDQVLNQLTAEPRAMISAAVLMAVLAVVPGLPAWPFLILATALGVAGVFGFVRERQRKLARGGDVDLLHDLAANDSLAVLELGSELHRELTPAARERGGWTGVAQLLAAPIRKKLGVPIGMVPVAVRDDRTAPHTARLKLRGAVAGTLESPGSLDELLDAAGGWLRSGAGRLLGLDETQALVDRVAETRPVAVRETVPKVISIPALTDLLSMLVTDGVSLEHLAEILEVLTRIRPDATPEEKLEQVRQHLAPLITGSLLPLSRSLEVAVLGDDIEAVLEGALTTTTSGRRLALPVDLTSAITSACEKSLRGVERPVVLVKSHLRVPVRELIASTLPTASVVAHGEIEPDVEIRVATTIDV
ncbi:MAG: FHIPEP family type III secretion protein [Deltaproteobacteria bacterium]|nr:FHIPEP family type III secretion protein [Deltaproteobacteria bacterium]